MGAGHAGAADVIVVGAGLAGLVAATEIADAGRSVLLLEREGEQDLGGQAWWSFGGLFMVDTPEQRRLGVRDSLDLARQDWLGSAAFDSPEDHWPRRWAEAYLQFAAGEKRDWLRRLGHRSFPVVGWAERGDGRAEGHGNLCRASTSRGDRPESSTLHHEARRTGRRVGRVAHPPRGRGAAGRGRPRERGAEACWHLTRPPWGGLEPRGQRRVHAPGGSRGGSHRRHRRERRSLRELWPARLGTMPDSFVHGVPASVDGAGMLAAERAGAHWIHQQRMWHYTEGIRNWDPIWRGHGIRILPGPSSLWVDARGNRLPAPAYPGFDTTSTLRHLRTTGHDHSWFVLTRKIIEKEFALSGSEQNPDLTGKDVRQVLSRVKPGAPGPVQAFLDHGEDFLQARDVPSLVRR